MPTGGLLLAALRQGRLLILRFGSLVPEDDFFSGDAAAYAASLQDVDCGKSVSVELASSLLSIAPKLETLTADTISCSDAEAVRLLPRQALKIKKVRDAGAVGCAPFVPYHLEALRRI